MSTLNGFAIEQFADISTCHVTESDGHLVTQKGDSLTGVISSYSNGWFVFIPTGFVHENETMEHLHDLEQDGFSQHYIRVIVALTISGVKFARFDADGAEHPTLPKFEW